MFKRQTTGSVVCASCGSLVGVRDEKCYNCGRRNPGLWGFAPLLRSLGNDLGFVQLVVWGCGALYVISLLLSGNAMRMTGGIFGFLVPGHHRALSARRVRRNARVPIRLVVDSVERRLASRKSAPHHLQHDVGTRPRPGRRRHVRRRPHGDHLHRRWSLRLPVELVRIRISPALAVFERRGPHRRSICLRFRLSRSAGLLRPPHGQLAGSIGGSPLRADPWFLRICDARSGQLCTCRWIFRGYLVSRVLDPLKPERVDHIVIALICIIATFLAVAASVFTVLPILTSR